jgi:hypothetical protein
MIFKHGLLHHLTTKTLVIVTVNDTHCLERFDRVESAASRSRRPPASPHACRSGSASSGWWAGRGSGRLEII